MFRVKTSRKNIGSFGKRYWRLRCGPKIDRRLRGQSISIWLLNFPKDNTWDKVFKNRLIKICGRQALKISLGPFLNILSQMKRCYNVAFKGCII